MTFYNLDNMPPEFVTAKHSTAFGALVSGEKIELGVFSYKAGEGARPHAHPQEQILLILKGRVRFILGEDARELWPRDVVHITPGVVHRLEALEDTEVASAKTMIDGVGHKI